MQLDTTQKGAPHTHLNIQAPGGSVRGNQDCGLARPEGGQGL